MTTGAGGRENTELPCHLGKTQVCQHPWTFWSRSRVSSLGQTSLESPWIAASTDGVLVLVSVKRS